MPPTSAPPPPARAPDLYGALGVPRGCSLEDIKRSYRKLALQYHPDKNGGDPESQRRFQEISTAYSVLSDPKKRQYYDKHGSVDDLDISPQEFMAVFQDMFLETLGGVEAMQARARAGCFECGRSSGSGWEPAAPGACPRPAPITHGRLLLALRRRCCRASPPRSCRSCRLSRSPRSSSRQVRLFRHGAGDFFRCVGFSMCTTYMLQRHAWPCCSCASDGDDATMPKHMFTPQGRSRPACASAPRGSRACRCRWRSCCRCDQHELVQHVPIACMRLTMYGNRGWVLYVSAAGGSDCLPCTPPTPSIQHGLAHAALA